MEIYLEDTERMTPKILINLQRRSNWYVQSQYPTSKFSLPTPTAAMY